MSGHVDLEATPAPAPLFSGNPPHHVPLAASNGAELTVSPDNGRRAVVRFGDEAFDAIPTDESPIAFFATDAAGFTCVYRPNVYEVFSAEFQAREEPRLIAKGRHFIDVGLWWAVSGKLGFTLIDKIDGSARTASSDNWTAESHVTGAAALQDGRVLLAIEDSYLNPAVRTMVLEADRDILSAAVPQVVEAGPAAALRRLGGSDWFGLALEEGRLVIWRADAGSSLRFQDLPLRQVRDIIPIAGDRVGVHCEGGELFIYDWREGYTLARVDRALGVDLSHWSAAVRELSLNAERLCARVETSVSSVLASSANYTVALRTTVGLLEDLGKAREFERMPAAAKRFLDEAYVRALWAKYATTSEPAARAELLERAFRVARQVQPTDFAWKRRLETLEYYMNAPRPTPPPVATRQAAR